MDSASFSSTMLYPTLPALPRPSAPPLYPELDNSYDSLIPPEPSAPPAEDSDAYAAAVDSDTKLAETMPASQLPPLPEFFIHEVRQSDTLQGLCLQYKISIRELKRYNQFPRVRIALAWHKKCSHAVALQENFRIMKKLRIPLVKGARLQEPATQVGFYKQMRKLFLSLCIHKI